MYRDIAIRRRNTLLLTALLFLVVAAIRAFHEIA